MPNSQTQTAPVSFDWGSILQIIVGIGKNNKQYRRLVVKNDAQFDRSLIVKAMKEKKVPVIDRRNQTGPDWGDDDLPSS